MVSRRKAMEGIKRISVNRSEKHFTGELVYYAFIHGGFRSHHSVFNPLDENMITLDQVSKKDSLIRVECEKILQSLSKFHHKIKKNKYFLKCLLFIFIFNVDLRMKLWRLLTILVCTLFHFFNSTRMIYTYYRMII